MKMMECDVILIPHIRREYTHFIIEFIHNGQLVGTSRGSSGVYGQFNPGSFPLSHVREYIKSDDKKSFRLNSWSLDEYITDKDFVCGSKSSTYFIENRHCLYHDPVYQLRHARVLRVATIPCRICPCCGWVHPNYYDKGLKISDDFCGIFNSFIGQPCFKFGICDNCRSKKFRDARRRNPLIRTAFHSATWLGEYADRKKDPRAFLYESKVKTNKDFFKKYISRHLNRVRKLRPISQQEVSFFRSWLGAKDIAALAN